jgi:hypothetical protein
LSLDLISLLTGGSRRLVDTPEDFSVYHAFHVANSPWQTSFRSVSIATRSTTRISPHTEPRGQERGSQGSRVSEPQNECRHWMSKWISAWLMMAVLDDVLVIRLFKFGKPDNR